MEQSIEPSVSRREKFRTSRFARGLTLFVIIGTILQIGHVAVSKTGADALLGTFSSLFIVLSYQLEDDWLDKVFMVLAFACLTGCWFI